MQETENVGVMDDFVQKGEMKTEHPRTVVRHDDATMDAFGSRVLVCFHHRYCSWYHAAEDEIAWGRRTTEPYRPGKMKRWVEEEAMALVRGVMMIKKK